MYFKCLTVSSPEQLGSHLKQLLGEAEMRLQELGGLLEEPCGAPLNTRASFSSIIGNAYPTSAMTGMFFVVEHCTECAYRNFKVKYVFWTRVFQNLRLFCVYW